MRYLLQVSHPTSYETLVNFMDANTDRIPRGVDGIACPFHYAAFFSSLESGKDRYWSSFKDVKQLIPGDVIVYLPHHYVLKVTVEIQSIVRPATHVMIVEKIISIHEDKVELIIIDSSRYPHCPEDSRVTGGVGRAPLTIHTEPEGMSIQWGTREKRWSKNLFFGRLKDI